MFLIKLLSKLPLKFLYLLSDCIFFFIYYVIKYRRKVVFNNLKHSFPEKGRKEIQALAKQFYHNFSDAFMEMVKGLSISKQELKKRVILQNNDFFASFLGAGNSIMIATSHTFNWEWALLGCCAYYPEVKVNVIYTPLTNLNFEKLLFKMRSRFGGIMVEKTQVAKSILRNRNISKVLVLNADQVPQAKMDSLYWTKFLNQDTAFFIGLERIPKFFNYPIYYMKMTRFSRGYYLIDFLKIAAPPYEKDGHTILDNYVEILEKHILEDPGNWLWSHRRWKF